MNKNRVPDLKELSSWDNVDFEPKEKKSFSV